MSYMGHRSGLRAVKFRPAEIQDLAKGSRVLGPKSQPRIQPHIRPNLERMRQKEAFFQPTTDTFFNEIKLIQPKT